jgi:hypothetical protein
MVARIVIIFSAILFFIPSAILPLLTYSNGNPQYLTFVLCFPFMGTCPFPINGNANSLADMYYWPVLIGLAVVGLGGVGLFTGKSRYAGIFVTILFLSWVLTLIRFIAMNERVY